MVRADPWAFAGAVNAGPDRPRAPALRDDEVGLHAVEDRLHVHDLHATILWLMGLDHMRLEYSYKGRPERPTINEGEVCRKIAGI